MTYTTAPLASIDYSGSHWGLFLVFCSIVVLMCIIAALDETESLILTKLSGFFILPVVFVVSVYISFTTGEVTHFKNEQVIAKLVSVSPEVYQVEQQSGKYKNRKLVDVHKLYAVYELPNSATVVFEAAQGVELHKTVVLYKN